MLTKAEPNLEELEFSMSHDPIGLHGLLQHVKPVIFCCTQSQILV
jgi:hypothetical protein